MGQQWVIITRITWSSREKYFPEWLLLRLALFMKLMASIKKCSFTMKRATNGGGWSYNQTEFKTIFNDFSWRSNIRLLISRSFAACVGGWQEESIEKNFIVHVSLLHEFIILVLQSPSKIQSLSQSVRTFDWILSKLHLISVRSVLEMQTYCCAANIE